MENVSSKETVQILKAINNFQYEMMKSMNYIREDIKDLRVELKEFKDSIEKKEKATAVESLISEVSEYLDEDTLKDLRSEGLTCDMCDMDGFKNKVKALCFNAIKKQPKKKNPDVWSMSAPINNQDKKISNSVWDRI